MSFGVLGRSVERMPAEVRVDLRERLGEIDEMSVGLSASAKPCSMGSIGTAPLESPNDYESDDHAS